MKKTEKKADKSPLHTHFNVAAACVMGLKLVYGLNDTSF